MSRRAFAILPALAFVAVAGMGASTLAGAVPNRPKVHLSTDVVAPGQRLAVIGTGWPVGTRLTATLCGANAVWPTGDCAQTTTLDMTVDAGGIWRWMTAELPPKPCPCVVLVSGLTSSYSTTLPVTVVGAATAPVTEGGSPRPELRLTRVRVVGGTTLASSFGVSAPRVLELRIQNLGTIPVTPVVLGRWGASTRVTNVISVPAMGLLGVGRSVEVRADFALPALSMGKYAVRVKAEVDGYRYQVSASTSTSTWPIALFILLLVLLVLIVCAFAMTLRKRRRQEDEEETIASQHDAAGDREGKGSDYAKSLVALGARMQQSGGGGAELASEPIQPVDLTSQLE